MATQRLYADVADEFRRLLDGRSVDHESVALAARKVAGAFKRDNPHFRYDRFYDVAGLDEYGMAAHNGHTACTPDDCEVSHAEQFAAAPFPAGRDYGEYFPDGPDYITTR